MMSRKESQVGVAKNNKRSLLSFCSQYVSHQFLMRGASLRSEKVIFSLLEKSCTEKYPFDRFNHLSTTFACTKTFNMGISKLTCTLKGVAPPEWLLGEDASPMGSRRRIWAKLSIIISLYHSRASSSNILKGSLAPSSLFSSAMGCLRVL